ncbi:MAG: hypothetical protein QOJ15_9061 [Bradyrhizobium sp.]|jgi:hypothetical protein|nr:hypothetical protein [Bradyrhizobium sp.]
MSEIYELSKVINANALALKGRALSDYDREALQRHMVGRIAESRSSNASAATRSIRALV